MEEVKNVSSSHTKLEPPYLLYKYQCVVTYGKHVPFSVSTSNINLRGVYS